MEVGDQDGLAIERRGEHDGRRTSQPVLDVVGDLAETPHVSRDDLARNHPGPVYPLGAFHEVAYLLETLPEGLLPRRLARRAYLLAQAIDSRWQFLYLDLEGLGDHFGRLCGAGQEVECFASGYDLDAVEIGAMLFVGEDLEGPDLGAAAHVRPAAQLARETVHLDDPDQVPVLLAEEHHRAEVARLTERRGEVPDRLVLGDLLQGDLLHPPDLLLRHPPRVT